MYIFVCLSIWVPAPVFAEMGNTPPEQCINVHLPYDSSYGCVAPHPEDGQQGTAPCFFCSMLCSPLDSLARS